MSKLTRAEFSRLWKDGFQLELNRLPQWLSSTESARSADVVRVVGSIPRLGRSPREGNSNPLHILAWKIPLTEETGGLHSKGSHKELDTTERLNAQT